MIDYAASAGAVRELRSPVATRGLHAEPSTETDESIRKRALLTASLVEDLQERTEALARSDLLRCRLVGTPATRIRRAERLASRLRTLQQFTVIGRELQPVVELFHVLDGRLDVAWIRPASCVPRDVRHALDAGDGELAARLVNLFARHVLARLEAWSPDDFESSRQILD